MGIVRLLIILILLLLNFLAAIYLETRMANNYALELFLIVLGLIIAAIMLIGIIFDTKWAWALTTIFFAASLANAVFLYISVRSFLVFAGLLFVNLLGLLVAVVSIREDADFMAETSHFPLDTYEEEPEVVYRTRKKAKKKKK